MHVHMYTEDGPRLAELDEAVLAKAGSERTGMARPDTTLGHWRGRREKALWICQLSQEGRVLRQRITLL